MPRRSGGPAQLLPEETGLSLTSQLLPAEIARLRLLFNEFDRDKDGRLDARDIAREMRQDGIVLPLAQLQECVW
ncbi:EF-hand domain-containing protein, putative [Eimeria tenella]|uniref:EF-hand domain-containing protein, putative n=1 Tax=Eimeria tenella TaxID=5802 RepID=U6KW88_EIMTE|nr:EF-hand domain-containing protein, putative [Eimeria tenella]CDJ39770.1 EF-hand domain-containing protein, putative [Eimeria tenella]|eukprot:XP_013230523.1 EF-hand domain-containing protein, putative [Eimeria tenella]